MLIPAIKRKLEVEINLEGVEPQGILEVDTKSSGIVSHRIVINYEEQYSKELINWLKRHLKRPGRL
jgi:hypothetical protein